MEQLLVLEVFVELSYAEVGLLESHAQITVLSFDFFLNFIRLVKLCLKFLHLKLALLVFF